MKKLRVADLQVQSFPTSTPPEAPGTVYARQETADPSCVYGSCRASVCGSCGEDTCEWTCGAPNYGCDSVDPRCTYGGVYPC